MAASWHEFPVGPAGTPPARSQGPSRRQARPGPRSSIAADGGDFENRVPARRSSRALAWLPVSTIGHPPPGPWIDNTVDHLGGAAEMVDVGSVASGNSPTVT